MIASVARLTLGLLLFVGAARAQDSPPVEGTLLHNGDRICLLGNALAERMQHHGWLETLLQTRLPDHELSFRNLGFGADTLTVRQRTAGFGSPDDYLNRCKADVVFAFFGYNESFAGADGLDEFKQQLQEFIRHILGQKYNGKSAARLVVFSPIAHEDLGNPNLPDGRAHNERIALYTRAMIEVTAAHKVSFIDLFATTRDLFAATTVPLTINGIHLNEIGNRRLAHIIISALFPDAPSIKIETETLTRLREAVLEKNLLWFNRYRATDGYNVYGGRSSLKYTDDLSNLTVLQREMEILDVMAANRDKRIWAIARGGDLKVDDSNAPPIIKVKTNKPGKLAAGEHEFPSGEQAIEHMQVAKGMKVNLYASEEQFPELVNPVQMAWDTRGRLWVAVWPTYPHWEPHQPMNDKLLILEDTDNDGRADVCKTFVGDLHNPTGFEFWNDGVLVAQPPDVVFLKDTDGDDLADVRERVLHGFSSADTHHSINSFVLGPGGALYFQEGTFHQSQIESIYGPVRNRNAAAWRFEPRTFRVERYAPYNFANPHGHVFDRWGQDFLTDGTGNQNYFALGFSGFLPQPAKHPGYFTYFKQRTRPCAGTEILSSGHFPPENQGNLLIADVIQFNGIMQYKYTDDGSGFGAVETEPIVRSSHPTFRPSDIEMGPDGALYFLDWSNPIIGHMQHHLRDPSRDHSHGRVYRVTAVGRPLLKPAKIAGQPIEHLLQLLEDTNDRVRYRSRIEISGRDTATVIAAAKRWAANLDKSDEDYEHHLLEGLWVHQQHNVIDLGMLEQLLRAKDYRARAAATRVLRYMRRQVPRALSLLKIQANDSHPRVRLEALVAASFFTEAEAVVVALEARRHPSDKFIDYALQETMKALESIWKTAIRAGKPFTSNNPAGEAFLLNKISAEELIHLPRSPAVYQALLSRHGVDVTYRREAAEALAGRDGTTAVATMLSAVRMLERSKSAHAPHVIHDLGKLIGSLVDEGQKPARGELLDLIAASMGGAARQLGYALLITNDGNVDAALQTANSSVEELQDMLGAVSMISDADLRRSLFGTIRPLMFAVPAHLKDSSATGIARSPGVRVSYYLPNPKNVDISSFDDLAPQASGIAANFSIDIPLVTKRDAFALKFSGTLNVQRDGDYIFFTNSDDGSRVYIDEALVVDNDGLHGMREKRGAVRLAAGPHRITVTYYDNGGGDGLVVSWKGPGFKKQRIPDAVLTVDAAYALRGAAVRAMAHVPGHAETKFRDAMLLIGAGSLVDATVSMIDGLPKSAWPSGGVRPLVNSIAAYLQGLPAKQRTLPHALAALDLGKRLLRVLPTGEAQEVQSMLDGLGGTIILIRTVPHQMLYDITEFQVAAGKPVAIVLQNNDVMPHNFVVTMPGKLAVVGEAAEKLAVDAGGAGLENFIPKTGDVLFFTKLLFPGETERLTFVAPKQTGDYPYVCTFPGHWTRMNGNMKVVDKVEGDPVIARTNVVIEEVAVRDVVKSWTMADLAADVTNEFTGRSMRRGQEMFTVAGCIKCHVFDGAGANGGPELTKITEKYKGEKLLQQLIEPSSEINEEYIFYRFILDDDSEVYGRITNDDGTVLHVAENLLTPDDVVLVPKDRIREQIPSKLSSMPTGLLVTLTREEILDLLAYIQSGKK